MIRSHRASLLIVGLMVALHGCGSGEGTPPPPGGFGGFGNNSGQGGNGGSATTGGTGGSGNGSGTGGMSTGGTGGSGNGSGTGATGGTGGTGNSIGGGPGFAPVGSSCNTNILCGTCPDRLLCASDDDCAFENYFCASTGCTSDTGLSIGQCREPRTPSCDTIADCPTPSNEYDCAKVGLGGDRCLRTAPGCRPENESIDCPIGYACEGGSCVDRRVPCDDVRDCPKSHLCLTTPTAKFCARVYRDCNDALADCGEIANSCADVDGDGRTECTGDYDGAPSSVCNDQCPNSDPVCENGDTGFATDAVCGDYGLCLVDDDCGSGFDCVTLGADGRRECVESGPRGCDSNQDCAFNEVCAAGRNGGVPECQAGTAN